MTVATSHLYTELPSSSLVVRAHQGGVEVIDQLADEWRELCSEAANDQPFYRPEFIQAHVRTMIPGARLLVVTVRHHGRLRFVLPLVEEVGTFSKLPVRRLRAPVDFHCGRFDAVRCRGPEADGAISAAWRYLKKMGGWDLLHLRYSQVGSTISRLALEARADGFFTIETPDRPNPYVPVPADAESLNRMPPNSKLRSQLRQIRLRMAEEGSLKFYRVDTADTDALDRLFLLEASGWKGRGGSAVNCHPPTRQFFNELAQFATRFGYLSLFMLEFKGELIAAHYSLTYNGLCHSPVVAYNEKFRQFAPGHLIVSEILKGCVARGIHGYDITGQDQDWKMKWATQTLPVNHHYIFRGRIGNLAYRVASKVRPKISRMLEKKRG